MKKEIEKEVREVENKFTGVEKTENGCKIVIDGEVKKEYEGLESFNNAFREFKNYN